tara:strand:+ start:515 stop:892 length:378 start_codon:yes stop_codon:yes gene_type:complete
MPKTDLENPYVSTHPSPPSKTFRLTSEPIVEPSYPEGPAATPDLTSIEAAADIADRVPALRGKVLRLLQEHPSTVHEAAETLGITVPAIQPRFSELRARNLITDSGEKRRNKTSGKRAIVWQCCE